MLQQLALYYSRGSYAPTTQYGRTSRGTAVILLIIINSTITVLCPTYPRVDNSDILKYTKFSLGKKLGSTRCNTLWLSPTESLSHLALRGPPALSRPALALPRRAQDRPPNRPDPRALPQQLSERAQPTTLPPAPPCASSPPPPISPSPTPHSPPLRCSQQIGIATGRSCQWSGCCRVLRIVVYRWWSRRCGIRT